MTENTNTLPGLTRPKSPLLKIEPASEWADKTLSALDSNDIKEQPLVATPGPQLPGAYPNTPSATQPLPSLEEVKEAAKDYIQAAGQYVPSQDDIRRVTQSASGIVTEYMPAGVASYLGSPQPQHQEPTSFSPIEEHEITPTTGGGFILLNRGSKPANGHTSGLEESSLVDSGIDALDKPGVNLIPNGDGHGSTHYAGVRGDQSVLTDDASTKTQPGSRALSVQGDGSSTIFGISAGAAAVGGLDNSREQAAPSYGSNYGHVNLNNDPRPELQGHPDGVVNHGDAMLAEGAGGTGIVKALGAGSAVGPVPGLTGRQEKSVFNSAGDYSLQKTSTPSDTTKNVGQTTPLAPITMNPGKNVVASSFAEKVTTPKDQNMIRKAESRQVVEASQEKENRTATQGEVSQPKAGKMDFLTPTTTPRTHPLAKEGANWKGVPLDEGYQAALDRDEERGLNIGNEAKPAIKNANAGSIPTKPTMDHDYSHVATDGHERATSSDTPSRFKEEPRSSAQESSVPATSSKLSDQPKSALPVAKHGEAVNGQNATTSRTSNKANIPDERPGSQRKSGFMTKIKAWSKRLSHEKKTTAV